MLINSATGVRQQMYYAFAAYLSGCGYTVVCYDYRGIGLSVSPVPVGLPASMRVWGAEDYRAVTNFIETQYPDDQKYCIGHSVGALILGMNPGSGQFSKFVFIATQDAYLGNLRLGTALAALVGFGILLPVSTKMMGYFPAHLFGLGAALPAGVAYDWRRLIFSKKSTGRLLELSAEDFSKTLCCRVAVIRALDDGWVTPRGVASLMENVYPNMQSTYLDLAPEASPRQSIGHIDFFRSYNAPLWETVLKELN